MMHVLTHMYMHARMHAHTYVHTNSEHMEKLLQFAFLSSGSNAESIYSDWVKTPQPIIYPQNKTFCEQTNSLVSSVITDEVSVHPTQQINYMNIHQ